MGIYDYLDGSQAARGAARQSALPASDDTSTLYDVDLGTPVNADQGRVLQVTRADGSLYTPMTMVKDQDQVDAYGQPRGTAVPIMVPPELDPQSMVDRWNDKSPRNPLNDLDFALTWRPSGLGGQNDFKNSYGPMYDAYGNFEYGASGARMGQPSWVLTTMGHAESLAKHQRLNDPINTKDIYSGADAITNGGKLSTIPISQWRGP